MKTSFVRVWLLISVLLFAACRATPQQSANTEQHVNPLLSSSPLPFQAPAFDKIRDGDFAPAFDAGMKEQLADVDEIANNPAPPTFENTIVALEKTGQTLTRVSQIFNALAGANTDDQLQKLQEEEAPKLAAHQDAINLNPKLFARIETLYNQRNTLELDPESNRLLEYQYQQFVMAGARLSDEDKSKLKKLNEEDAALRDAAKISMQINTD
jgi:peptidyl-dipeptidase Dcp